jgi:segregation and condensation protein A
LEAAPSRVSLKLEAVTASPIRCPPSRLDAILGRMYGEPIFELPKDLYIPPDALEVILDCLRRPARPAAVPDPQGQHQRPRYSMVPLTAQYLDLRRGDAEAQSRAGRRLSADGRDALEIKSRMLLPRPPKAGRGEPEDPRAELVRRLLEYEQMKLAAAQARCHAAGRADYEWVGCFVRQGGRAPAGGESAGLADWPGCRLIRQARVKQHHTIRRDELSVREHMTLILRRLAGDGFVAFERLFETGVGIGAPGGEFSGHAGAGQGKTGRDHPEARPLRRFM